ncbi:YeeE/YedE thiosulfate transporter family protein [Ancylomarina longa]|uniref:Transporter n=1 Tax=Ancylomarina longa TaxID=2487017 RepID=A0A434AZX5_9BACT|nr:YeeE/YedE thiosulfate transporter family protein [Ancylomarina longa]RUT80171.1 transporter [Ancylomarina longa]
MEIRILIFGFLFGGILQYASLNKYNVISGLATLDNYTVAKAIAVALGVGAILLNIEIGLGMASFHIKPLVLGGILLGGLIFGSGMAILGYCPGTLAVSLGEGSIDAFVGIIGGLLGGFVFTILLPFIKGIIGPNLGAISLNSLMGTGLLFFILVFIIGGVFVYIAFWLNKKEGKRDYKWLYAGIALAVLNVVIFSNMVSNRPIGASTSFPYLADYLSGFMDNSYFQKIQKPGNWEAVFLGGAFLAGLFFSLLNGSFKFTLIHENWKKYKGISSFSRVVWAFVGGFILIFGARMAGGCTSGHILSGGMQLSISSLIFAVFTFLGLVVTGKLFYKKNKR